jgi:hypothetical protein
MANKTYAEKLKDPRWQRRRLEVFQRDKFTCQWCFMDHKTLHVHHLDYIDGREPWDYPMEYLQTLCHECHEEVSLERPVVEKSIIKAFRLNFKNGFEFHTVRSVFTNHKDVSELFFLLYSLMGRQEAVMKVLNDMYDQYNKEYAEKNKIQ